MASPRINGENSKTFDTKIESDQPVVAIGPSLSTFMGLCRPEAFTGFARVAIGTCIHCPTAEVVMPTYPTTTENRIRHLAVFMLCLTPWHSLAGGHNSTKAQKNDQYKCDELKHLRKENVKLKEERAILKKAAAFMNRNHGARLWEG